MLNTDPQRFVEMVARGRGVIEVPTSEAHLKMSHGSPVIELPVEAVQQAAQAIHEIQGTQAAVAHQPGSPIAAVSDVSWLAFVACLSRESPEFSSSRHVGQYRQRRERLAELGVDPNALCGSAQAQRAALDADLADAHHHAVQGGLVAEHLGRPIALPGQEESTSITLSGLLGVIQCAGLEGAVGWLERPNDRKRYPNTTAAFQRTNGVF